MRSKRNTTIASQRPRNTRTQDRGRNASVSVREETRAHIFEELAVRLLHLGSLEQLECLFAAIERRQAEREEQTWNRAALGFLIVFGWTLTGVAWLLLKLVVGELALHVDRPLGPTAAWFTAYLVIGWLAGLGWWTNALIAAALVSSAVVLLLGLRGRFWTMRQYSGFGTAEETNGRFRYLLDQGQTGLSVAFDLPTQIGYDSDDPMSLGEVGKVGVPVCHIADMEALFDQIPLAQIDRFARRQAPDRGCL